MSESSPSQPSVMYDIMSSHKKHKLMAISNGHNGHNGQSGHSNGHNGHNGHKHFAGSRFMEAPDPSSLPRPPLEWLKHDLTVTTDITTESSSVTTIVNR
ncbi:proline-rich nuclear receptor coactivator 2-like [Oppia nitens]|uniref:proline-rich nuclear receptor coactivator 2-like n=1 Tax=Oppia nitens TaxID=1686743 RepID=UPI0023DB0F58|nr:proline-rich nuclear receptor coactivator 2-like [Oppia nitens]